MRVPAGHRTHPRNTAWFGATLAVTVFAGLLLPSVPTTTKKDFLRALQTAAGPAPAGDIRIAVGYNANLDLVAPAPGFLRELQQVAGPLDTSTPPRDASVIDSSATLVGTLRYFAASGGAAERAVSDATVMGQFVTAAEKAVAAASGDPHAGGYVIGGNAANMAVKLVAAAPHARVLLGGPVGARLRGLLPSRVAQTGSGAGADEVHLILEYSQGDTLAGTTAARANRFIVSHDVANAELHGLSDFHKQLRDFAPAVLVVGGLHMLETLPAEKRSALLQQVTEELKAVPAKTAVHVEFASFARRTGMEEVMRRVLPLAHSIGLNEQELGMLDEILGGTDGSVLIATNNPNPTAVAGALRRVMRAFPSIVRVHFHSLSFHVIAMGRTGKQAIPKPWGSAARGVAAGSVAATLQACGVEESALHGRDLNKPLGRTISVADPEAKAPGEGPARVEPTESAAVVEWTWRVDAGRTIEYALAPVIVCVAPKRTVGLGDAISASGLLWQIDSESS